MKHSNTSYFKFVPEGILIRNSSLSTLLAIEETQLSLFLHIDQVFHNKSTRQRQRQQQLSLRMPDDLQKHVCRSERPLHNNTWLE